MEVKKINGEPVSNMPCCGIFAAAVASGKEPQEVFEAYKLKFNKTSRWRGSTMIVSLKKLMNKELGVKYTEVEGVKLMTVRKFYESYAKPSATYILWVRGHVMAINKGRLIDQWHCEPIAKAKKSRCRVEGVIEITNAPKTLEAIPSTEQSKTAQKEYVAAKNIVKQAAAFSSLPEACEKYGLWEHAVAEFKNKKYKLFGFEAKSKKYPFVLIEVLGFRSGKPEVVFGERANCSVPFAQGLFGKQAGLEAA
tara:strand:+ start:1200 stop:1952 length:753 start_codon:yes stop_codon:yes gene_type:complete